MFMGFFMSPMEASSYVIDRAKQTPREGYVIQKIANPEDVWAHSREAKQMALYFGPGILGSEKEARRAGEILLFHDIAEGLSMDFTPDMLVPKKEKSALERDVLLAIKETCHRGKHIFDLWSEYEDNATKTSHFCHGIDKLQLLRKVFHYEKRNASPYSLKPFWDYALDYLSGSPLEPVAKRLRAARPAGTDDKPVHFAKPMSPADFAKIRKETHRRIARLQGLAI